MSKRQVMMLISITANGRQLTNSFCFSQKFWLGAVSSKFYLKFFLRWGALDI
jgi:hypothetical protein